MLGAPEKVAYNFKTLVWAGRPGLHKYMVNTIVKVGFGPPNM